METLSQVRCLAIVFCESALILFADVRIVRRNAGL